MKNILKKGLALSLLAAALSPQVFAASTVANFNATATLNPACIFYTESVAFGSITPAASGVVDATGGINIQCSRGLPYIVTLDKGTGTSISDRSMAGSGANTDRLAYNLYKTGDLEGGPVFGNGVEGSNLVNNGSGVNGKLTLVGRLSLKQYVKADVYTDNLIATLTY